MKVRIDWTYKSPKNKVVQFLSEELDANEALMVAQDLERTGRTKRLQFADRHNSNWSIKELKNYVKEVETEPHEVIAYYDGGFDRHSKRAGLGCAVYFKQNGKDYRLRKMRSLMRSIQIMRRNMLRSQWQYRKSNCSASTISLFALSVIRGLSSIR